MSLVLAADEAQLAAAKATAARVAARLGRPVRTEIRRLESFYPAEDYHQKYALRGRRAVLAEMKNLFPSEAALRDSTAAARLNAWLGGERDLGDLAKELEAAGLAGPDAERIAALAGASGAGGASCRTGAH
jgi:hypothetical protein